MKLHKFITAATIGATALSVCAFTTSAFDEINILPVSVQTVQSAEKITPPSTAVTKIGRGKTALRINWTPVDCTGYKIYSVVNGTKKMIAKIPYGSTNYRFDNLSPDTQYTYVMRTYNINADGKYSYSPYTSLSTVYTKPAYSTAPETVDFSKINIGKTAIRLAWNTTNCDGYQVFIKEKVNGKYTWRTLKTTSYTTNSYRISKLPSGTKYYFKVRGYNVVNGKKLYGKCAKAVEVTTKSADRIVVKDGITYVDGILIANKTYSLPSTYNPGGLTAETSSAFSKMQQAAANDGISLWNCSGFRSYYYQQTLYNNYVSYNGQALADTFSARPGHSEHQTGLALDVNNASSSFEGTKEAIWLANHCTEYGFIIRYPADKVSITGYKYEPWHIRYLGKSIAQKVADSGLCLEEYLGITSQY